MNKQALTMDGANACVARDPRAARFRRSAAGFTLIELTAAVAVTAVIGSMAAAILIESSRIRAAVAVRAELSGDALRTLELMLRYAREIKQDAALTGLAQISTADGATLAFDAYAFRLNGGEIQMSIDSQSTWRTLARNAQALTLRYYRADGTELTPKPLSAGLRQLVRQVSIELQLLRGTESARVRSRVYLRSFMNETS